MKNHGKNRFLHEMLNRLLVQDRPNLTPVLTLTQRLHWWRQRWLRRC